HGANRLGGNGVAESTVFGGIAGDVMAESVAGRPLPRVAGPALEDLARRVTAPLERPATRDLYALQRELRDVMWEEVGLVRDARGDRKSTRLNSSHVSISYAVFCLK